MNEEIPPNVQHHIQQFQQLQQQYEMVVTQKQRLSMEDREIDVALSELEETDEKKVYKNIGSIMLRKDTEKVVKELKSRKEEIELKKGSLERQEKRITKKLKEMQEKIQSIIGGTGGLESS
ncbi:MAG: prefoldin subunit beta [Euryarchaeota archaeon]|nr:prefoldin subunit beta [Euryarchaeota archaeon]